MGGRHGAALFCVANCDFGFAANCASTSLDVLSLPIFFFLCNFLTLHKSQKRH